VKVTVSPEALADLKVIASWIARDNPARAETFPA
jgi:plasmid stabilization system protein ParE